MPSIVSLFRGRVTAEKANASVQIGLGSRYEATGWTFTRVAQTVLANPTGARCVDLIQSNFSRPDWALYKAGTKDAIEDNSGQNLLNLLNKPNVKTSGAGMRRTVGRDLTICGKSFWLKERGVDGFGDAGPTTGLRRLAAQRVTVMGNEDDELVGFLYTDRNGQRLPLLPDDVLYLRYPHPEREYDGLAPALAAGLPSDTDNAAQRFNYSLIANDGAVPGYLTLKNLTPQQFKAWKAEWESGAAPGRTRFLSGEATYSKVGQTNQELAYDTLRDASQHDIARGLGVPFVVIEPSDATFANMSEARSVLWQQTIMPGLDLVADDISIQLGQPEYGIDVGFKLSEIDELNEAADAVVARMALLLDRSVITINEAREKDLQLDPVEWGDLPVQPAGPMKIQPSAPAGQEVDETDLPDATVAPPAPKPKPKMAEAEVKAVKPDGFDRRVELYEARMARKMRAYFARQGRVIAAKVRAQSGKSYQKALSDDTWSDPMRWTTELADDLDGVYTDVVDAFATSVMAQLRAPAKAAFGGPAFDARSARIRSYIESRVQQDSVYINATTTDDVRSIISDLTTKGASIADIAAAIEGYFSGDESTAAMRAERVARTEVIGAANFGTLEGAMQSDVATGKTWLAAGGGECPECAGLDGETVGLDEDFSSGDPQPPDHPNCRCTVLIETDPSLADGASDPSADYVSEE